MKTAVKKELDINDNNRVFIPMLLERLDQLSRTGGVIQAQPIGMMRIALNQQNNNQEGLFLHVWSPDLPIQATGGPFAHTHVFDLESKVVKGEIKDIIYKPVHHENGDFNIVKGLCLQDHCSLNEKIIDTVNMEVSAVRKISAGQTYNIPKGEFHLTKVQGNGLAMTVMRKTNIDDASPLLAIPNELTISKESFDRNQLDQCASWKRVKQLLMDL